jgi:hypothetical protein
MSKDTHHVQCKLSRSSVNQPDYIYRTAYIPERYAIAGNKIKIDDDPVTKFGYVWLIEETYNRLPSSEVNERGQDYKRTRKASDV